MMVIGIDLGGTKVSAALYSKNKEIAREKFPLEMKSREGVIEQIFRIIEKVSAGKKISAICVGVPGSFSGTKTVILPNLPQLNDTDIGNALKIKFKCKTFLENDANCFALGEAAFRKEKNLVGVTLGTGLGGGIISNGKIYSGAGNGAQFGHMSLFPDGKKCSCGSQGCLEEYASGRAIEYEAQKIYGERIKPEALANLARRGDAKAMQVYVNFGRCLGIGLANINYILNPETIVIGGSVSGASDLFMPSALDEMRKRSFIEIPKILTSTRDGCYGAALVAMGIGKK